MESKKCYIENRIWYIGYTQINFDAIHDDVVLYENRLIEKRSFAFATSDNILYISFKDKLKGLFQNNHYSAVDLEFKFLNNGCVNIILAMVPNEVENFGQRVENLDEEGAEFYEVFTDDILYIMMPLLQYLVNNKIIECHDTSLWGIPSLLSKNGLDFDNLNDFGKDLDQMYGTKTLYYSVLYFQHVLSSDDHDYSFFKDEDSQPYDDISLRLPSKRNSSDRLNIGFAWARKFWNTDSHNIDDVKYFLEVESIYLSKYVILSTSIIFNTELSLVLFRNKHVREDASVDALRLPNALVRTHLASTEMYTQLFFEESKKFYRKIELFEFDDMQKRIKLQEESEETMLLIADSIEMGNDNAKAEWLQFFLVFLSGLTMFSVSQDVVSFTLVGDGSTTPKLNPDRVNFFLGLFIFIIIILVLFVLPKKIFGWNWKKTISNMLKRKKG